MFLRLFTVFCLTASLSHAGPASSTWDGTANITFSGTSTLHDWSGTVRARPFALEVSLGAGDQPQQLRSKVTIDAAAMDTADKRRDQVMRRCMKVEEHPLIEALIDVPAAQVAADGKTPTRLPLTLHLLGKSHALVAEIRHWRRSGDQAEFDLHCDISLKEAGIEVPSVLWLIRVGDTIRLQATVRLTRH